MCGPRRREPYTDDGRLARGEGDVIAMTIAVKVGDQRPFVGGDTRDQEQRAHARQPGGTAHGRGHAEHPVMKYTTARAAKELAPGAAAVSGIQLRSASGIHPDPLRPTPPPAAW